MNNNNTYQILIEYINENKIHLSKENLIFYLNYAVALKKQNIENAKQCDLKEIIKDLNKIIKILQNVEKTDITYQRLEKILEIYEDILNKKDLEKISYKLDKLYIETDLGVRNNSVLTNTLIKQKNSMVKK